MTRGRGYGGPRGSSFRGSGRGGGSWGGGGGRFNSPRGGRFNSPFSSTPYDNRKYSNSDRYAPRHSDDYRRSYRPEYSGRDPGRSPERKRPRPEASSSRHDSYGGYGTSRYESSYSDRRSFSSDRHPAAFSRRSDFRRPSGPPPSGRGGYRGRISSRGGRGMKFRDRPMRRRLLDSSYSIRRRAIAARSSDFSRRLRLNKLRSAIARRNKKHDSDKEDDDDESDVDEEKTSDSKAEEKEGEEKDTTKEKEDAGSGKDDAKSDVDEKPKLLKNLKTPFIKLLCPHCGIKCLTFRKYEMHLLGRTHKISMRQVAIKQKSILQHMRLAQRNAQNELEKSSDDLTSRTSFCPICKLNYKQKKAVHQATEAHKNMKKFLMPYCKICNITFKSPMTYESHCCTIEHLKRKQRVENGDADSAEEDNLENFTTIDSVGDNDEEEDSKEDVKVNVGIEHIRKIEAQYCDLCKMYLPRGDEEEMQKILVRHCKNKVHMQRYVRKKELEDLEKRAEKLQRKETAEKEVEKIKEEKMDTENGEGKENREDKANDDEEARDDKLWADVDKDLGDILAEAESGNKSSDEDEEDSHANAERYDRFKYSEKNGDEKLKKVAETVVENGEPVKVEEVKKE